MANTYDVNDGVECSVTFKNEDGDPEDPTTVVFKLEAPDKDETTYTYLTDVEVVRDGTGEYHVDVVPDASGRWAYRFEGTGAVTSAAEGWFLVRRSAFE